uniref:uncharacterized protein LOC108950925 isoform X5 n=1 Tax=Ciona intestinalis TaxID=7719 RepID=UPI000EF55233|nr:uncharacterized protein LOC108950925 isoform X5 [Ciona intestinalis]|eukprot:XP_026696047.1 uncharacterized protein LOC108950925 isoform X5 [Ciona intestinalis]
MENRFDFRFSNVAFFSNSNNPSPTPTNPTPTPAIPNQHKRTRKYIGKSRFELLQRKGVIPEGKKWIPNKYGIKDLQSEQQA